MPQDILAKPPARATGSDWLARKIAAQRAVAIRPAGKPSIFEIEREHRRGIEPEKAEPVGVKELTPVQIERIEAEKAERTAEWEAQHIKLDTEEWVAKEAFDELNSEDQAKLVKLGIDEFNRGLKAKEEEFKAGHIQLDNGDWISREEYTKLSPTEQVELKQLGVEGFNKAQKEKYETEIKKVEEEYKAKIAEATPKAVPLVEGTGQWKGITGSDFVRASQGDVPVWMLVPDFSISYTPSGSPLATSYGPVLSNVRYPFIDNRRWEIERYKEDIHGGGGLGLIGLKKPPPLHKKGDIMYSSLGAPIIKIYDEPWTEETYLAHLGITPEEAKKQILGSYHGAAPLYNNLFSGYSYIDPETGERKDTEGLVNPYGLLDKSGKVVQPMGTREPEYAWGARWPESVKVAAPISIAGLTGIVTRWPETVAKYMPEIRLPGQWPAVVSSVQPLLEKLSQEELQKQIARGEIIKAKDGELFTKEEFETFTSERKFKLGTVGIKGEFEKTAKGERIDVNFLKTMDKDYYDFLMLQGIGAYNIKLATENELIKGQWIPKTFLKQLEETSPDDEKFVRKEGYDAYIAKMDEENIRISDGKGGFQWFSRIAYAQMEKENLAYATALKDKGYDTYIEVRKEKEYELPDGYWMPKTDLDNLPKPQQDILKEKGVKPWRDFIIKQETTLAPFSTTIKQDIYKKVGIFPAGIEAPRLSLADTSMEKVYDIVTALKKAEDNPSLRTALESLYPQDVLREFDLMAGTLKPPKELASDNEFYNLFRQLTLIDYDKKYQEYAKVHPDDPRVIVNRKIGTAEPIHYADAVVLAESYNKSFFERVAVEGDVFSKQFERAIDKLGKEAEKANTAPAIVTLTDSQIKDDFGASLIKGIDTAKANVANFWTEEELDKWIAEKDRNPVVKTGAYASRFAFDIVKILGATIPLTLVGNVASLTYGDVSKAARDTAELVGGMALFPVFFVGQEAKAISLGQYEKAIGNSIGLGAVIVISPAGAWKYVKRVGTKLEALKGKVLSPGTGSITVDIPMNTIGRQTPGVINTMDSVMSYFREGEFRRDRITLDSTGKMVTRIMPLARAGIKNHYHVSNRFNEYADAIKSTGKIINPGDIASRDSPFPGKGTYNSPNISIKTGLQIEPATPPQGIQTFTKVKVAGKLHDVAIAKTSELGKAVYDVTTKDGLKLTKVHENRLIESPEYTTWKKTQKSGIVARDFEFQQMPKEIQKIYNELSQLDMKRTPFDVIEDVLNRAVDKYLDMEAKQLLEAGTYPMFKMWWAADYAKLIDLLVKKGIKEVKKYKPTKLTEAQMEKLNYYFENKLTAFEQNGIKKWTLENESYTTFNAPTFATKVTKDTRIKELGGSCGGSYIKASEKMVDPNGRVVFKEGGKIPIMWVSEKPNQLPPKLEQRMIAEYIYEPLTTLRRLFTKPAVKLGYKGSVVGDLVGLEITKRPNVNDYLNLDRRATAILRNPKNENQILVGRQYDVAKGKAQDYFDTIGGAPFSKGEALTETIVRESAVEGGVYATGGEFLGTLKGRHMNTRKGLKFVEEERFFDIYNTEYKGTPKISGEIVELAWYNGKRLYDMNGKPMRGKVSDITPRIYNFSQAAPKNIKWDVVEPKSNVETTKAEAFKMTGEKLGDRWTVKQRSEQAIVILEDSRGYPLTVNNNLLRVERKAGETVFDAIKKEVNKNGMDIGSYSYVTRWLDFPSKTYSLVDPGMLTDLYVVRVKNLGAGTKIARGDELRAIDPRSTEAYFARKDTLKFKPVEVELTANPLYISADLPLIARSKIVQVQASLKAIAKQKGWDFIDWQSPDALHITLKYNGHIPIRSSVQLAQLIKELNSSLARNPIHIGVKEWEAWPNYKDVDVISMRLSSTKDMHRITDLQRRVDAAATKAGLPADTYRFEPHVTIGTVRKGTPLPRKMQLGAYISKNPIKEFIETKIDKVSLNESRRGTIYKSIDDKMTTYVDKTKTVPLEIEAAKELPPIEAGVIISTKEGQVIGRITPLGELRLETVSKEIKPEVAKAEITVGDSLKTDNASIKIQLDSFKGLTEVGIDGTIITLTELKVKKGADNVYVNGKKVTGTVSINYGDYIRIGDKGIAFIPKEVGLEGLAKAEIEFGKEAMRKVTREEVKRRYYEPPKGTEIVLYPGPYNIYRSKDALEYYEPIKKLKYTTPYAKLDYTTPYGSYLRETPYGLEYTLPNKYQPLYYGTEKAKYAYGYPRYKKEVAYPAYAQAYPQYPMKAQYPVPTVPYVKYPITSITYPPKLPPAQPPKVPPKYPPKVPPPARIVSDFEELTREQRLASVAWRQGFIYHLIYPPFLKTNVLHSRDPFPGVKVVTGPKSAFKSLSRVRGVDLPDKIYWDLGIQDIVFEKGKGGVVSMKYIPDPHQRTYKRGPVGMPQPRVTRRVRGTSRASIIPVVGGIK